MALYGAVTLGNLAAISGGDALETGVALTSQRIYNRGYRYYHPLGPKYEGAKPVYNSYGLKTSTPAKRPGTSLVSPSPGQRQRTSGSMAARSRSINHHMSDKSHGTGQSYTANAKKVKNSNLGYGKLYWSRIVLPPAATSDANINRRDNNILLKGVKINRYFYGQSATKVSSTQGYCGPAVINWALIQFNCRLESGAPETTKFDEVKTKFFADTNSNDLWYAPFDEWPSNTFLGTTFDLKMIDAPMSDKNDYRILTRKRMSIDQFTLNDTNPHPGKTSRVHKYFRMPQRIYLEAGDLDTWEHPIYEVWWGCPINEKWVEITYPTTGTATHYTTSSRNQVYFNELNH